VELLTAACRYSARARTSRGGWGYIAAGDGSDFDEGCVTVAQVQALDAARLAGVPLAAEMFRDAHAFYNKATTAEGGVLYSLASGGGGGRPPLTAAALAVLRDADADLVRKWHQFCRKSLSGKGRLGHDEYTHYYYAQVVYRLGEGWKKLFPD